jgi:hypothetical protein
MDYGFFRKKKYQYKLSPDHFSPALPLLLPLCAALVPPHHRKEQKAVVLLFLSSTRVGRKCLCQGQIIFPLGRKELISWC